MSALTVRCRAMRTATTSIRPAMARSPNSAYQLIRQRRPVDGPSTVEIEFDGASAEAYCFTFG